MPLSLRGRNAGEVILQTVNPTPTTQSLNLSGGIVANGVINATSVSGNIISGSTSFYGFPKSNTFTSPGTFTVPATTTRIKVTAVAGAPGAAGLSGNNVIVSENSPALAPLGYRVGSYGGFGGSGGTTSFGSFVTVTSTGTTSTNNSIANLALNVGASQLIGCSLYGTNNLANSSYVNEICNNRCLPGIAISSVVYLQGPFPSTIPVTIGAGGGGGGGGSGGSYSGSICCGYSIDTTPTSYANGSPGVLTSGGAGAPSPPVGPGAIRGAGGAGGGGAGASGYTTGTGGAGGTKGTTTWNAPVPVPARIAGSPTGQAGPSGSPNALVTGGAGGNADSYPVQSTPGAARAGGAGGGSGFSGILIVEYN